MMRNVSISALLLLVTASIPMWGQAEPESPTPEETGANIGTIVSSAIDKALPGVGTLAKSLIDIIKGDKKPKEKVKQLEAKVAELEKTEKLYSETKKRIGSVAPLASQLIIVKTFVHPSFAASLKLNDLNTYLKSRQSLSREEQELVKFHWNQARDSLAEISAKPNEIESYVTRHDNLQQTLLRILAVRDGNAKAIDDLLKSSALVGSEPLLQQLKETLETYRDVLSAIDLAIQVQMAALSSEVKALADWAADAKGDEREGLPEDLQDEWTRVQESLSRLDSQTDE